MVPALALLTEKPHHEVLGTSLHVGLGSTPADLFRFVFRSTAPWNLCPTVCARRHRAVMLMIRIYRDWTKNAADFGFQLRDDHPQHGRADIALPAGQRRDARSSTDLRWRICWVRRRQRDGDAPAGEGTADPVRGLYRRDGTKTSPFFSKNKPFLDYLLSISQLCTTPHALMCST